MKQKLILPLEVDEKMQLINEAFIDGDVAIELPRRRSPRKFFLDLLMRVLLRRAPRAILVRYLNSPTGLLGAVNWWFFTAATVIFGRICGITIIWIAHNVDRETIQSYETLTLSLRRIVAWASSSILVTDPLLVGVAKKVLPSATHHKLDWITFGERRTSLDRLHKDSEADGTDEIVDLLCKIRRQNPHALIGFCPTSAGRKYVHLQYSPSLTRASAECDIPVHLVIVGPVEKDLPFFDASDRAALVDRVHVIPRRIDYDPVRVSAHIDFYWRALSDQSVSYTLYEAASVRLPTLTMRCGFVGIAVAAYRLGACLELDFSNLSEALTEIRRWDKEGATMFLKTHSWSVAAERISRLL